MSTVRNLAGRYSFVVAIALVVPAGADTTGPVQGFTGSGFVNVKSPLLAESEAFSTTWAIHFTGTMPNYAGLLFGLIYDLSEISSLNVAPAGPHWLAIQGATLTLWHNNAAGSGFNPAPSSTLSLFRVSGIAQNTTTLNNSDIDISIGAWRIMHIDQTTLLPLNVSDCVYKTPMGFQKEFVPGNGLWFHVTAPGTTWITASAFVATQAWINDTGGYGVEHVPEPVSILMLVGGAGALVAGRTRRRRVAEMR